MGIPSVVHIHWQSPAALAWFQLNRVYFMQKGMILEGCMPISAVSCSAKDSFPALMSLLSHVHLCTDEKVGKRVAGDPVWESRSGWWQPVRDSALLVAFFDPK